MLQVRALAPCLAFAWVLAACDLPPERESPSPNWLLGSTPISGEEDVPRGGPFILYTDRPIAPGSVHRGTLSVRSGERSVYLGTYFEPVDRLIVVDLLGASLVPEVQWRMRADGLRDLDGRDLPFVEIPFVTGLAPSPPPAPSSVTFADVAPIFARCASSGCHEGPAAVLGLDLSGPEAIERTAIGVSATQVRASVDSPSGYRGAFGFVGLPRIDVVAGFGRPGASYLLYKVLDEPRILGERMPPSPEPPLGADELRTLSRWIRAGAPLD